MDTMTNQRIALLIAAVCGLASAACGSRYVVGMNSGYSGQGDTVTGFAGAGGGPVAGTGGTGGDAGSGSGGTTSPPPAALSLRGARSFPGSLIALGDVND